MDVLKQFWAQTKKTWEGLTSGQRAAAVALVGAAVVVLAAVPLWGGASSERVPLFARPLESDEKVGTILGVLKAANIDARVEKGQILVPSSSRDQAFTILSSKKAWPEDQSTLELSGLNDDWRIGEQARRERARLMLQSALVRMIRKLDGVHGADVLLAEGNNAVFAGERFEPKAAVMVTLKPGTAMLSAGAAETIRRMVAFGVQGVQSSTVNVSDSQGRIYPERPADDDQQVTTTWEKMRREKEEENVVKVRNALAPIIGNRIAVSCAVVLNRDKVTEEELRLNPDEVVVIHEKNESKTVTGGAPEGGAVPGVFNNLEQVPAAAASTGNPGGNSTEEKSELERRSSEKRTSTVKGVGDVRQVSVGILIPFAKGSTEPDAKILGTYREFAMNAVGILEPKLVTVAAVPYEPEAPLPAPGRMQELRAFLMEHFDRVLLAVLVLGALVVLGLALRRGSPRPALAPAGLEGAVAAIAKSRQQGIEPLPEMGAEGKRFNEMEGRIREQVRKDPKIAAGLVKRWLMVAK